MNTHADHGWMMNLPEPMRADVEAALPRLRHVAATPEGRRTLKEVHSQIETALERMETLLSASRPPMAAAGAAHVAVSPAEQQRLITLAAQELLRRRLRGG